MALELQVDREPPPGWDDAIRAAGGNVFATEAWAEFQCHGRRGDALYCRWTGAEGAVARALGIRRPGRASRAGRVAGRVIFDTPPVGGPAGQDHVAPLRRWARRRPALLDVELRSADARGAWCGGMPPEPVHRLELVRTISTDGEALVAGIHAKHRRSLKKAADLGVAVREVAAGETTALRRFAELGEESGRQLERRKGVVAAKADLDAFAGSLAVLMERRAGRLWLAEHDGAAEAGAFFGVFGDSAYYLYSGASEAARDLVAVPLALGAALRALGAAGVTHVNLGGVGADAADPASQDHGLLRFKARWGAEPVPRLGGVIALRPRRAAAVARLRRLTGR